MTRQERVLPGLRCTDLHSWTTQTWFLLCFRGFQGDWEVVQSKSVSQSQHERGYEQEICILRLTAKVLENASFPVSLWSARSIMKEVPFHKRPVGYNSVFDRIVYSIACPRIRLYCFISNEEIQIFSATFCSKMSTCGSGSPRSKEGRLWRRRGSVRRATWCLTCCYCGRNDERRRVIACKSKVTRLAECPMSGKITRAKDWPHFCVSRAVINNSRKLTSHFLKPSTQSNTTKAAWLKEERRVLSRKRCSMDKRRLDPLELTDVAFRTQSYPSEWCDRNYLYMLHLERNSLAT